MTAKPQVLFIHTNYPAQFRFLVKAYLAGGWDVWFASHTKKNIPLPEVNYLFLEKSPKNGSKFDQQQRWSLQAFYNLLSAKRHQGLLPLRTYVHTGWGLGQFIKDIFPKTNMIAYSEWWFNLNALDFHYDRGNPEISHTQARRLELVLRNQAYALELQQSDMIISPTQWQRSQLPNLFKDRCEVVFDGIDSEVFSPKKISSSSNPIFACIDNTKPLLTYATRGLEPYRGFPEFVDAALQLLKSDPDWQIVIAGEDKVNYYRAPGSQSNGYGAKAKKLFEDMNFSKRVHFVGSLPLNVYRDLLRLSDLHCYFTRPYVLSWSLLESSLVGCRLFSSATQPVLEFLQHDKGTTLVDHTSRQLGEYMIQCASHAKLEFGNNQNYERLKQRYVLKSRIDKTQCMLKHMEIAESLA